MRHLASIIVIVLLVGGARAHGLTEAEARHQLATAGIALWPAGVKADSYRPPYSNLQQEPDGTLRLYLRDKTLTDLSVLADIPISSLYLDTPQVKDLTPLSRLPLVTLTLRCHPDADVSPLRGKQLRSLSISGMQVHDLSFLRGMPLEQLGFNPYIVTNGLDIVTSLPHLDSIGTMVDGGDGQGWTKAAFGLKLRHGGFRPDTTIGPPPDTASVLSAPILVTLTTHAGYVPVPVDWDLTILSNRMVLLMIRDWGEGGVSMIPVKRSMLSVAQLQTLRRCLADSGYFSLPRVLGDDTLDSSSRTVSVRVGDYQRTIIIRDLSSRLVHNDPQLADAKRLITVWQVILSFVELPKGCLDFSEEDRAVMKWGGPNESVSTQRTP